MPPATPPPPLHPPSSSHLWASPQFSDYFSDAGDSLADRSVTRKAANVTSPIHTRILTRLDAIARKVANLHEHDNDGSQTPALLDFDAELSALEARVNAPESQTREILEGSGDLFNDEDDESEAAVLMEENEGLRREVREGRDVIARVTKLRESLQGHYDEMKNNFNLASQRLTSAGQEITELRTMNETLKNENENLRDHNARLHTDLTTAIPTIFRLKAQLDVFQGHMDSETDAELSTNLQQLQHEWADVDRDFQDIYRRYRKQSVVRQDSVMASGNTPPMEPDSEVGSREGSPERMHRSRIIIRRGGFIRRIDAEPSAENSEDDGDLGETLVGELEAVQLMTGDGETVGDAEEDDKSPLQEHGEVASSPDQENNEHDESKKLPTTASSTTKATSKDLTPWQELVASIADFAGWHDAYDD